MEPTDPTPEIVPAAPAESESASAEPLSSAPQTEPPAPIEPEKPKEGLWETVRSLIVVLAAVLCMRTFVLEATVIPTGSMENTILIGDHVFLNKLLYGPRIPYTSWRLPEVRSIHRGDIVAFRYPVNPTQMFVKRVIGRGGDVIKIVNKKVYVNGKPLDEPYAGFQQYSGEIELRDNFPPPLRDIETLPAVWGLDPNWARQMAQYIHKDGLHVPEGHLFCMGDNRDNSLDSRFWGFVPLDNVVGEPLIVYWSYDASSNEWMSEDLKDRLKFDASIVWNFIQKTRWSRTGKIF